MSRIGKKPIVIPSDVQVKIQGQSVVLDHQKRHFSYEVPKNVQAVFESGLLTLKADPKDQQARPFWGTARAILANAVAGMAAVFKKNIQLVGVGYRASVQGRDLVMQLGYSHDVRVQIPEGINVECEKPTEIQVSGASKEAVGRFASNLQSYRPPEPYKGKGVLLKGKHVYRKVGKKK